jgi:hypothetical protein
MGWTVKCVAPQKLGTDLQAYVRNWLKVVNWDLVEDNIKRVVRGQRVALHPEYEATSSIVENDLGINDYRVARGKLE